MLFAIYLLQAWLGIYIHRRRDQGLVTKLHPPSNILHVVLGLSTITLAFFQVQTGLIKLEYIRGADAMWSHVLLYTWAVVRAWAILHMTHIADMMLQVLSLAYCLGLMFVRRQFRQEREGVAPTPPPKHYTPLSDDETQDPLLFRIGEDEEEADASDIAAWEQKQQATSSP